MAIGDTDRDDIREAGRRQFWQQDAPRSYAQSYVVPGPSAHYFSSRLHAVSGALASRPGGDLLDVGCGPGMMVQKLRDTRPEDFSHHRHGLFGGHG